MKKRLLLCIWIMTGVIAGCSSEKSHTNTVNIDKVEIVAPNVQGAGWDLTARAMQKTLTEEKIFTKPITVTNKVGGSGDVGWKYTKQKGGHVLAINSSLLITNNLLGHSKLTYKEAGKIKILAVSAPKRLDRLPEIPTWKEQGINVIFQHWKGIMGPKDMTEEEVAYWDGVIKKMVESDSWKGILRERGWESFYKGSWESRGFLEESNFRYEEMVKKEP